jgi:HSP20 family protein
MLSLWNPFSELMRTGDDDRWPFGQYSQRFSPAVDVREESDAIVLQAELPGMKPEDVKVNLEGNLLTISGERKHEHEKTEEGFRRIERSYGSFSRSFTLPDTVELDRCDAEMKDGILTIKLPKSARAQPRQISVKSGAQQKLGTGVNVEQKQPDQQGSVQQGQQAQKRWS